MARKKHIDRTVKMVLPLRDQDTEVINDGEEGLPPLTKIKSPLKYWEGNWHHDNDDCPEEDD